MWLHKIAPTVRGSDVDKLQYVDSEVKAALAPIQDLVQAFAPHGWTTELTEHHLHLGPHSVLWTGTTDFPTTTSSDISSSMSNLMPLDLFGVTVSTRTVYMLLCSSKLMLCQWEHLDI